MISSLIERSLLCLKKLTKAIIPIIPAEINPIYLIMNKATPEKNSPASQIILPLVSTHLYNEIEVHSRKRMKGPSDQVKENIKMLA